MEIFISNLSKLLLYVVCYFGLFVAVFFFITFFQQGKEIRNPKPKRLPYVTIAVPACNEEKTIAKTIKSLLDLDYPKEKLEIIVVDDGSEDNTYKMAKRFCKDKVLIFRKDNGGKGSALNYALRMSKGELFGALDADSFVDSGSLKKMVGYFEDKRVMSVTPSLKIYKPKGILQRIQSIEYLIGVYLRKVFGMLGSIHVTPGPFTIYKKDFFLKHGGYDESNLTEDIEIALRIQSKRFVIENAIDADVYTVSPNTFKALTNQRKRWYLGFMNNVIDYKRLFSGSYGNLGLFILPASFLFVILLVIVCFVYVIKLGINIHKGLINLAAINFDILSLLKFNPDFFLVGTGPLMILAIISFLICITMIYIAKILSKEKQKIVLSCVYYMFIYWFVFAYWWILAGFSKVTKRKISWGKKAI